MGGENWFEAEKGAEKGINIGWIKYDTVVTLLFTHKCYQASKQPSLMGSCIAGSCDMDLQEIIGH